MSHLRASSSPPRRYRSLESRHKAGLYRSGKNYVDRLNIFSGLLKDLNLDVREPTTTSGALTPKPPEYVSQFWDRWSLFTELVIPAWPVHAPVRPTNNGRCDYARLRARLKFPRGARMDRARIARAHRLRSKAIFPAIWSSGIRSSMPSSVCSVAPWTTFSRAPEANNARSTGRPAVSAKSVSSHRSVSAQWRKYTPSLGRRPKRDVPNVRFSNRPSGVKRVQAIHQLQCRC